MISSMYSSSSSLFIAGEEEKHFKGLFERIRSNGCYSFPHAIENGVCTVSKSSKNSAGPDSDV